MRDGMRSGVTSLPVLALVLHTALSCVKAVDLFRNADICHMTASVLQSTSLSFISSSH